MSNFPPNTKSFSLDAAIAGHPLITRAGQPAKFIAYVPDAVEDEQLITLVDGRTRLHYSYGASDGSMAFDLFLAPLGYCEGKPVFSGDVLYSCGEFIVQLGIHYEFVKCKWPSKSPVVETRISANELRNVYNYDLGGPVDKALTAVANKAIERAIADGDVIPTSLFVEMACKVFNKNYGSNASFTENAQIVLKDYLEE